MDDKDGAVRLSCVVTAVGVRLRQRRFLLNSEKNIIIKNNLHVFK